MTRPEQHEEPGTHLMTVAEVAATIGMSPDFVYREVAARRIGVYSLRGQIRIDASSLSEYLERHHRPSLETIRPSKKHF
ncbi:MAG: helix-turn-helix domain-containing protein [Planctomycetota bacterium]